MLIALVLFAYFIGVAQNYYNNGSAPAAYSNASGAMGVAIAILIISLVGAYFVSEFRPLSTKSIIFGIAFAPIGILIWLYGDYGGGPTCVGAGLLVLIIGIALWAIGDISGGAFSRRAAINMGPRRHARRRRSK